MMNDWTKMGSYVGNECYPVSKYTKKFLLEQIDNENTISQSAKDNARKLTLPILRMSVLVCVGTHPTGNMRQYEYEFGDHQMWRHTKFYAIDIDKVNSLAAAHQEALT